MVWRTEPVFEKNDKNITYIYLNKLQRTSYGKHINDTHEKDILLTNDFLYSLRL